MQVKYNWFLILSEVLNNISIEISKYNLCNRNVGIFFLIRLKYRGLQKYMMVRFHTRLLFQFQVMLECEISSLHKLCKISSIKCICSSRRRCDKVFQKKGGLRKWQVTEASRAVYELQSSTSAISNSNRVISY